MNDFSPVLAQNLKALRQERGLSLPALSKAISERYRIKISVESLTNYEVSDIYHSKSRKNEGMSVKYLYCLADFYGVSTDYLLGRTETKTPDTSIQTTCAVTGLSESAVESLAGCTDKTAMSAVLEQPDFTRFVYNLRGAVTYNPRRAAIIANAVRDCFERKESAFPAVDILKVYEYESSKLAEKIFESAFSKLTDDEIFHMENINAEATFSTTLNGTAKGRKGEDDGEH